MFYKGADFPFSIVKIPYFSSNIPLKIFYSSCVAEILRIARITTTLNTFNLYNAMNLFIKQNDKSKELEKTLDKMIVGHFEIFESSVTLQNLLKNL